VWGRRAGLTPRVLGAVGRGRSESTRQPRWPVCAVTTPKFATVVDLPSPGLDDVTTIVRHLWSRPANWIDVRRLRYDSAAGDFGSEWATRLPAGPCRLFPGGSAMPSASRPPGARL